MEPKGLFALHLHLDGGKIREKNAVTGYDKESKSSFELSRADAEFSRHEAGDPEAAGFERRYILSE
jgi:hypothetical protein